MITNEVIELSVDDVFAKNHIDYILTVPCSIISTCFKESSLFETIYLSREEEGVGIASGLTVSGKKAVMMIQNSGFGNCINAIASLTIPYNISFIIIITLRGDEYEDNPVQVPMGEATKKLVQAIDCDFYEVSKQNSFDQCFKSALADTVNATKPIFILLPRLEALS